MPSLSLPRAQRARGVTAVLGPTNTGKTHLAIERMLGHSSGLIGLPLRLLAREVYQRLVDRAGAEAVALITGEEKIKPPGARYHVATAEAMPRDLDVAFVAIDEIQLAQDMDRGHVFTDHLLNRRGREETLVIGSASMRGLVETLLPGVHVVTRPRLSKLSFAGEKKLTRLPSRSAIVAFSAEEVYQIAELLRRQRGGAAVVLGALSPRTRNAQVALFQSGDVEHIVATDAIGMGLNLDIDHVAFAGDRKFDGHIFRRLMPGEMGQIAGRAGRHLRDGTFGTTGRCAPFEPELIEALEQHRFDPVPLIQWRNPDIDLRTAHDLRQSLAVAPEEPGLARAPRAEDEIVFDIVAADGELRELMALRDGVATLWEFCSLPDYRKMGPSAHAEVVGQLFGFRMRDGAIPEDWFRRQVNLCDRLDGEIDTLSARIAQIRTWTFCANRDWLKDPLHWQGETRAIEDRLSDALHERLSARFVDRRTSVLMRRLRENAMPDAEVSATGDVMVEGQHVGQLMGFRFTHDQQANGSEAKALQAAALKALAREIELRAERFAAAGDDGITLSIDGTLRWLGAPVARLVAGERVLDPRFVILADEHLTGPARERVEARLAAWLKAHVAKLLGPLVTLEAGEGLEGIARGVAYQVAEALGVLDRSAVANDVKSLDQEARSALRKLGLRFGAYHLFVPALLKPAPRALAAQLWALKHGGPEIKGVDDIAHLAASGRTSFAADPAVPKALYRVAGFRVAGPRAIRVDILERLADLIRPAIAYRPGVTPGDPPPGAHGGDGFTVTVAMTSLAGCAGEDFAGVLKALGYRMERKPPFVPPPKAPANEGAGQPAGAEATPPETTADASDEARAEEVDAPAEHGGGDSPVAGGLSEPAMAAAADSPAPEEPSLERGAPTADAAPAAPAEPVLVEVWRPGRFERQEGRPEARRDARPGPRRGAPRGDAAVAAEASPGGREGERPRRFERRDGDRPPRGDDAAGDSMAAGAREAGRPPGGDRGPRRHDGPRDARREDRQEGRPEARQEGRPEGRQETRRDARSGGRRDERPEAARERGGPPGQNRPGPRPEKQPDPDSPFAALLALKAQLEAKQKG